MHNVRCGPPLAALVIAGALSMPAFAQDPIKIGVLEDQSGDFAAATMVKVHAIELATEEINAASGIGGRPIELVVYDTQSDNLRYQESCVACCRRTRWTWSSPASPRPRARLTGRL
jgi:branched-chain amino acid transport system substrate-binding protein